MLHGKPIAYLKSMKAISAISILLFVVSCAVVPKDYPPNKPFVFKTNINIEGKFKRDEKNDILSRLETQMDDSIRVRTVQKFIFWNLIGCYM